MSAGDQDKPSSDNTNHAQVEAESPKKMLENASQTARASIRSGVHSVVTQTNRALAALEEWTGQVQEKFNEPISKGLHQGSILSDKVLTVYERRHEFGPHIVVGTGLLVGGVVSLRRGRLPGAFVGLLGSGIAYGVVYEPVPVEDIIDSALGSRRS